MWQKQLLDEDETAYGQAVNDKQANQATGEHEGPVITAPEPAAPTDPVPPTTPIPPIDTTPTENQPEEQNLVSSPTEMDAPSGQAEDQTEAAAEEDDKRQATGSTTDELQTQDDGTTSEAKPIQAEPVKSLPKNRRKKKKSKSRKSTLF